MTTLHFTACPRTGSGEYLSLAACHLTTEVLSVSGTAAPVNDPAAATPLVQELCITASEAFEGVVRIALPVPGTDPRFFLPGFLYGTNRGEAPLVVDSKCPRLRRESEFPASPWWMVRSDRLSHPCAFAWSGGRLTGFAATPYYVRHVGARTAWEPGITGDFDQYTGFGCALDEGALYYTLGYENAPWLFVDSHKYSPRAPLGDNCITLEAGERLCVRLYLFDLPAADERALHTALRWVYGHYHVAPARPGSVYEAVASIAGAITRDAWLPEKHMYSGFVFDMGDHDEYRPLPSIAWTNGLAAATPMLLASHRLGDDAMRAQAIDCIDHIVHHSLNKASGLPYMVEQDGVWSNRGWWYERLRTPGHAGYLVGQCVYLVLKAWDRENQAGTEHRDWLDFAAGIIARTERTRNADGEYPYVLSDRTGAGLEYDAFSGAWCLAAAAYWSFLTGDRQYLPGLLESEGWYHRAYICHQECYGGPLDIDKNIDSEGVLAYIRAVHYLHAITGDPRLLDHLKDALEYEYTFKFCYNSPIKVPPLSETGWSSCGGSSTSVTNPHIHPMSSSVMDEMVYYLAHAEDGYIRSRLMDTLRWSCQCHNTFDGEFGYGRKGWMSERFCHSEGLLTEYYPDGSPASTWFALMPWACGSLLEGLTGECWEDLRRP